MSVMDIDDVQKLLLVAVQENDPEQIRRAIEQGADVNYHYKDIPFVDRWHQTHHFADSSPLMLATSGNYEAAAIALLEHGADPFVLCKSFKGTSMHLPLDKDNKTTPMHLAAWNDMRDFIRETAEKGYDLSSISHRLESPLITAACRNNYLAVAACLEVGADANGKDENGFPALRMILGKQTATADNTVDYRIAQLLLEAGTDLEMPCELRAMGWKGKLRDSFSDQDCAGFVRAYDLDLKDQLASAPVTKDALLHDGKPTKALLQYCGDGLMQDVFSEQHWKGREAEGLALFEEVLKAVPPYYQPYIQHLDLAPLLRHREAEPDGPAVERYVRRTTGEKQR